MSGRMQENSDIAARLVPEETRAGGMTTPVLWRAEASIRMERMASALVTASKEAITSFAKFLTVHIIHGSMPSETSPMWKPATGEPCAGKPPARFGGRGGESLPYPYHNVKGTSLSIRASLQQFRRHAQGRPDLECGRAPSVQRNIIVIILYVQS